MATPELLIKNDLQLKYQPLWDRIFQATYQGVFPMPQTGTPRDVLSITEGDHLYFAKTLSEISNAVLRRPYGRQVWKAITGPEDIPGQTDYRLWVEPGFSGVIPQESIRNFKVEECSVEIGIQFSHIVRIRVSVF